MKIIHIWLFIINCFLFSSSLFPQENDIDKNAVDSINRNNNKTYTIRFGIDLSKPILSNIDKDDYRGIELVGDLGFLKDLYAAIEIGTEKKNIQSENINFTSSGSYLKLGVDYNMYENWKGMNNNIYLGIRLGNSFHKQTINEYDIYSKHHYWEEESTEEGYEIGEKSGLEARWLEFVAGIKVKIISNFYLGFSFRLNRLINHVSPKNFDNLYIPGFNKKTDENNWGGGFNYTITYSIPINFRKN
ncbi:MAG: DUF6048 family protein [Bacteroidota bacterium]|nr:DUF6048 family protein [Bacteroidota bacterium]